MSNRILKITLIITCLLASNIVTHAQQHYGVTHGVTGVNFQNITLEAAIAKAKKENKYVFVSLFATWCGWCTHMKNKTYTNKKLGDYINSKFIAVRINGEKGLGRNIVKKYGVTAYPAQLAINTDGQLLTGSIGYLKPDELLKQLTATFK